MTENCQFPDWDRYKCPKQLPSLQRHGIMNIWKTLLPDFRTKIKFNHISRIHGGLFPFIIYIYFFASLPDKLFHFKGSWAERKAARQRELHSHTSLTSIRHILLGNWRPWLARARFDYWIEPTIRTSDAKLCACRWCRKSSTDPWKNLSKCCFLKTQIYVFYSGPGEGWPRLGNTRPPLYKLADALPEFICPWNRNGSSLQMHSGTFATLHKKIHYSFSLTSRPISSAHISCQTSAIRPQSLQGLNQEHIGISFHNTRQTHLTSFYICKQYYQIISPVTLTF